MPNYRPDLLPFALPVRIGLPYHGLCRNNKVGTVDYPNPGSADTILVEHPRHSAPLPELDPNKRWQEYALLSGTNRRLGGFELGQDKWLYCDANYTWLISFALGTSGINQTIDVWLESLFGVFPPITMTRRKLATYTYTPKAYTGANQTEQHAGYSRLVFTSHSKTGNVTYLNVAAYSSLQPWKKTALPWSGGSSGSIGIHDTVKVTISGSGSIVAGLVGDGISAAITHVATAPQMIIADRSFATESEIYPQFIADKPLGETGSAPSGSCGGAEPTGELEGTETETYGGQFYDEDYPPTYVDEYTYNYTLTTQLSVKFYYCIDKTGNETALEISRINELIDTRSGTQSGVRILTINYYWTACSTPYDQKMYTVVNTWSGSTTWSAEWNLSDVTTTTIKFAGKEKVYILSGTATPTTDTYTDYDGLTGPGFPLWPLWTDADRPSDFSYELNGVSVNPILGGIGVLKVSNNILEAFSDADIEPVLLPLEGVLVELEAAIGANDATLEPMTGEVTVSVPDAICYV